MFNEEKKDKKISGKVSIMPLKDFHIVHNNVNLKIIKGEEILVDKKFIPNLRTEKVIR